MPIKKKRRRAPRSQAGGEVTIRQGGTPQVLVRGELLEVSPDGFRIRHSSPELQPGLDVEVVYCGGEVKARIVWRIEFGDHVESGFLLLR